MGATVQLIPFPTFQGRKNPATQLTFREMRTTYTLFTFISLALSPNFPNFHSFAPFSHTLSWFETGKKRTFSNFSPFSFIQERNCTRLFFPTKERRRYASVEVTERRKSGAIEKCNKTGLTILFLSLVKYQKLEAQNYILPSQRHGAINAARVATASKMAVSWPEAQIYNQSWCGPAREDEERRSYLISPPKFSFFLTWGAENIWKCIIHLLLKMQAVYIRGGECPNCPFSGLL